MYRKRDIRNKQEMCHKEGDSLSGRGHTNLTAHVKRRKIFKYEWHALARVARDVLHLFCQRVESCMWFCCFTNKTDSVTLFLHVTHVKMRHIHTYTHTHTYFLLTMLCSSYLLCQSIGYVRHETMYETINVLCKLVQRERKRERETLPLVLC